MTATCNKRLFRISLMRPTHSLHCVLLQPQHTDVSDRRLYATRALTCSIWQSQRTICCC